MLFEKVIYIWVGLPDFREGQGKLGLKSQISHFLWLSKGICPNGWEALNYIFLDQKFPSVIRICMDNWKIMHFEAIFRLIPQL